MFKKCGLNQGQILIYIRENQLSEQILEQVNSFLNNGQVPFLFS